MSMYNSCKTRFVGIPLPNDVFRSWDAGIPEHLHWNGTAIRGLTYMITDKRLQAQWLKEIGKVEDGSCVCDGWTQQNAALNFALYGGLASYEWRHI